MTRTPPDLQGRSSRSKNSHVPRPSSHQEQRVTYPASWPRDFASAPVTVDQNPAVPSSPFPSEGDPHELQIGDLLWAATVFRMEPLHSGAAMVPDEPSNAIHVDVVPFVAFVDGLVEQGFLLDDVLHGIQHLW